LVGIRLGAPFLALSAPEAGIYHRKCYPDDYKNSAFASDEPGKHHPKTAAPWDFSPAVTGICTLFPRVSSEAILLAPFGMAHQ
jgi:hypothetical protein